MTEAKFLHERVNDYLDFLQHPHVAGGDAIQWNQHPLIGRIPVPNIPGVAPAADGDARAHAPSLGQHTGDILSGLGYGDDEIAALYDADIVAGGRCAPSTTSAVVRDQRPRMRRAIRSR